MSLVYANQQITTYLGIFLVIGGLIGNLVNVIVFSSVRSYRQTPCTFYFLVNSIDSALFITINLTSRIVSVGFGVDLTRTSLHWCKARQYFIGTLSLFSFICSCLASVDQFFATTRNIRFRRLSNIKWTYRVVFILTIVCCLHAIPCLIFYQISPTTQTCINTNSAFVIYTSVYSLLFTTMGPISTMIVFGYLTYRNIHSIRFPVDQQFDRQLIKMTLCQVLLVSFVIAPYGILTSHILITSTMSKDSNQRANENFALSVLSLVTYFYYAGSCYVFLISSSRFRRTVKKKLLFWQRNNQINPSIRAAI